MMPLVMCDPGNHAIVVSSQDQWPAYQQIGFTLYGGTKDEYGQASQGLWCYQQAGVRPPQSPTGESITPGLPAVGAHFDIVLPIVATLAFVVVRVIYRRLVKCGE